MIPTGAMAIENCKIRWPDSYWSSLPGSCSYLAQLSSHFICRPLKPQNQFGSVSESARGSSFSLWLACAAVTSIMLSRYDNRVTDALFGLHRSCSLGETCQPMSLDNNRKRITPMCRACVRLLYESTKEVQPHAALQDEAKFAHQLGMLHFLVCTDKDCGTRWERLVRPDAFSARPLHTWKLRRWILSGLMLRKASSLCM